MSYNNIFKIWVGQSLSGVRVRNELFRDFENMPVKDLNSADTLYRSGPNLSFSRPTSATFYSSPDGFINTVDLNVPRFEYSRDGQNFKGLLIEEQRTNLVENSTDFNTSTWLKSTSSDGPGVSIELAPSIQAPDGSYGTVSKMYMNPARGYRAITWVELPYPDTPLDNPNTILNTYARSIYIKKDTASYITLACDSVTNSPNTTNVFDLDNPGYIVGNLFYMFWEPVRDGWYRIGFFRTSSNDNSNKFTIGFSPVRFPVHPFRDRVTGTVYTQEDTIYPNTEVPSASSVYVWGAQVEEGWLPTSYIPTSGSQVTRAGDKVFTSFNTFINLYNPLSGSFFVKGNRTYDYYGTYLSVSNLERGRFSTLGANRFSFPNNFFNLSAESISLSLSSNSVYSASQPVLLASSYSENKINFYENGELKNEIVNISYPRGINKFYIGSTQGEKNYLNGHILKLHYWPYKLENSVLSTIT